KTHNKIILKQSNPLAYTFKLLTKKLSDTANKKDPKITTAIRYASIRNMCDSPFLSCQYFDGSSKHILNEGTCLNFIHIYALKLFNNHYTKETFYHFLL